MEIPITNSALLLVTLLGVALLVPILCERFRISGIVGLIIFGVILGPNAVGLLERGELVTLLGQAGLLFIVFVAGLEIDLGRFRKYRRHSIVFGGISYLIPQFVGFLVAIYWLNFSVPSAILLGSMFGSHTLLSYPIAARLGIVRSVPVTTCVGGTIMTDTAAILVLAVVANTVLESGGIAFWVLFTVFLGVFGMLVFFVLPPLARWFYRYVPDEGARDFLFTILMLFLFAWLAEIAGLQPILGAFLCGIALNRLIPERSPLMNRIQFVGRTLLVPMFLLSVGMLVDPRALISDWVTIQTIVAMSLTVVVTKLMAAFLAGKLLGYSTAGSWVLFGMSVNQAAATLAAVIVGFNLGLFSDAVVNGAIIMILVTTLIGPYCTERWGKQMASEAQDDLVEFGELPQRILIPVANPDSVDPLIDLALLLREPKSRDPIYPMAIVTEGVDVAQKLAASEKLLARASIRGSAGQCPVYPISRVDINIAEGIRRTLPEQQITTIVIGWSGRTSFAHRIFGGVLDQLLMQSRQTVFVAKITRALSSVRRIILAVPKSGEFEPTFAETLHHVKVLSQQLSAPLHVIGPTCNSKRMEKILRRTRPDVKVTAEVIPKMRGLIGELSEVVVESDLIILLSARSHRMSWSAELESLPRLIAEAYPENQFLVLYPPDEDEDREREEGSSREKEVFERVALLEPPQVKLGLSAATLEKLLEEMLSDSFPERPELKAKILKTLLSSADEYPIEVGEGVYLIHGRERSLAGPKLWVASLAEPYLELPHAGQPLGILLALIAPVGASAEMHLSLLRNTATFFRDEKVIRTLREASDEGHAFNGLKPLNDLY